MNFLFTNIDWEEDPFLLQSLRCDIKLKLNASRMCWCDVSPRGVSGCCKAELGKPCLLCQFRGYDSQRKQAHAEHTHKEDDGDHTLERNTNSVVG